MTSTSLRPHGLPEARAHVFPVLARSNEKGPALFALDSLGDLHFTLDAPLGALEIDVRGLLELRLGSVLQLDRLTGEPLEVVVNGTPIARGEVRIQGERFAIRVTEILRSEARDESGGGTDRDEAPKRARDLARGDGSDARARVGG